METVKDSVVTSKICCYCNNPCSGANHCLKCALPCHPIPPCSFSQEEEGDVSMMCCDCWFNDEDDIDQIAVDPTTSTSEQLDDALARFINNQIVGNSNCKPTVSHTLHKRRGYTIKDKLEILDFAKSSSVHAASRQFKVSRRNIRTWKKQETDLRKVMEAANRKRLPGAGRKLSDAKFDEVLAEWVRELREKKLRVTRNMIIAQALQMSADNKNMNNFSASQGWLEKFMHRHNFSLRRPTSVISNGLALLQHCRQETDVVKEEIDFGQESDVSVDV